MERTVQHLEDIGFYTLSDFRAGQCSTQSPLWRCELLVTNLCNFACPYCRHVGPLGHMAWQNAQRIFDLWVADGLKNVRLSGGEPTLWPHIVQAVDYLVRHNVERIAISTNGSSDRIMYERLLDAGVSDFSISLDACCASKFYQMSGGKDAWKTVTENIRYLSAHTYVTVGVVLTADNEASMTSIIDAAMQLGCADIRVIPAAQYGHMLANIPVSDMPILEYRRQNANFGVRGLRTEDCHVCRLVLDDMAVIEDKHYPCIIYAREGGKEIGTIGPTMRTEREVWSITHDCHIDPICSRNCLDVCRDYNNKAHELQLSNGKLDRSSARPAGSVLKGVNHAGSL